MTVQVGALLAVPTQEGLLLSTWSLWNHGSREKSINRYRWHYGCESWTVKKAER